MVQAQPYAPHVVHKVNEAAEANLGVVVNAAPGRRTLMAMVVTFGFAVAVQIAWAQVRLSFGHVLTATTHTGVQGDNAYPKLPGGADVLDQSYLTASGARIGYGSCSEITEKATAACLKKEQVGGWAVDYLPVSQMSAIQWMGAAVLLALTAALAAFILIRGRKHLL